MMWNDDWENQTKQKQKQKQKQNMGITVKPNQEPSMHYWDLINVGLGPNSKKLREVVNDDEGIDNEEKSLEMYNNNDIEGLS